MRNALTISLGHNRPLLRNRPVTSLGPVPAFTGRLCQRRCDKQANCAIVIRLGRKYSLQKATGILCSKEGTVLG